MSHIVHIDFNSFIIPVASQLLWHQLIGHVCSKELIDATYLMGWLGCCSIGVQR